MRRVDRGGQDRQIALNDGSSILLKGVSSINHNFFSQEGACDRMERTIEAYRFTWWGSFDGDAVIEVGRGETPNGDTLIMVDGARRSFGGQAVTGVPSPSLNGTG